jgi:transcription-repair coupling factor (superfamily II helicase)
MNAPESPDLGQIRWPKPGQSLQIPRPHGSADGLLIAQWLNARLSPAHPNPLTNRQSGAAALLVAADPSDAGRLTTEITAFAPSLRVRQLADWEILPYEAFSPHQDLISERLQTLYEALTGSLDLLVVAASTALARVCPTDFVAGQTFFLRQGQTIRLTQLREQLQIAGYTAVSQVVSPGEYALRGGIIDLFPTGCPLPYRLELFDDSIESIRVFDPDSQRSIHPVKEIRLLPGREYERSEKNASQFRSRWREVFEGDPSRCSLYRDAANAVFGAGIEFYLPLLYEQPLDCVTDYLNPNGVIFTLDAATSERATTGPTGLDDRFQEVRADIQTRYAFLSHDIERPVLPPDALWLKPDEFHQQAKAFARLSLVSHQPSAFGRAPLDVRADRLAKDPVHRLRAALADGQVLAMACESEGRRQTLGQYLEDLGLPHRLIESCPVSMSAEPNVQPSVQPTEHLPASPSSASTELALWVAPLQRGFELPWAGLTLLTEAELFADMERRLRHGQRERESNVDAMIRDLSELKVGDPVVHLEHGVGRYEGLEHIDMGEGDSEFLKLIYANNAVLYVPVSALHLIGRYSGTSPEQAPLHSLGSGQWDKARRKAAQQARDTAVELLDLYARRAARKGHAFGFHPNDYERFADGFGFEETPDQRAAIHAVIQDMIADKPMDRLVCGDVGFGKTEVALRAAFMAVMDGKQVAVLCPTTLLAEQHFQTFQDRFAAWPVKVAEISRFKTAKEIDKSLQAMSDGQVDIVIGTHKLLSSKTTFSRLGLVIIDEEHRFGVRQKEALKNLRAEIDVLTLTATPIPRTLAMSLEGIRDFSVIATAPQKRLAIKTFVRRETKDAVREALLRELKRGGQAYVLHNEVNTIEQRLSHLQELVPEARIAIAHGQMHERDLERVMRDFHQQRINVLLCTTIIETGIDVPTANTIVIYRADKFGLAQLHQLRGRVGRSHHQAYAYLLIPDETSITKDAGKRLEAIAAMEELGSGFYLAMHDLEIRGAGEVLGDDQSGNMTEVGFSLYNDLLQEAVAALKSGRTPDLDAPLKTSVDINLHQPALLPADYCADIHERLTLYKRMASAQDSSDLRIVHEELVDRFGSLPEPTKTLLETHRLRLFAQALKIKKLDATTEGVTLTLLSDAPVDPTRLITLIQKDKRFKLLGPERIRMTQASEDLKSRLVVVREALVHLFPTQQSIWQSSI